MFENDYNISGKHATYLKFLAAKNAKEEAPNAGIFERYIDVYMNAAVFGLMYSRRAEVDTNSDDRARIYADAFARERENCMFLYRLVMLLDKSGDISDKQRIDRAFRYDSVANDNEQLKKNLELFHSYVRGGIEYMYEQFTDGCHTREDYVVKTHEFMTNFKNELEGRPFDDELSGLINRK